MSDYDVVVVGAGNAAFCAALAAQEQGAKVVMLEAAPEEVRVAGPDERALVYRGGETIEWRVVGN